MRNTLGFDFFFSPEPALASSGTPVTTYIQHPEHKGEKRGRFIVPVQIEWPSKSFPVQEFLFFPLPQGQQGNSCPGQHLLPCIQYYLLADAGCAL